MGVRAVKKSEVHLYGIVGGPRVDNRITQIERFVEKPEVKDAPSNLAVTGRYVITPLVFEKLAKIKPGAGGEYQITDAIAAAIHDRTGYACEYEGEYYDCGNRLGFLEANVHFAFKHQDKTIARELKKFVKKEMGF
jgi:UTP--glucose-1-phosphate uridylyltransferase